jgi:hypothetical protein
VIWQLWPVTLTVKAQLFLLPDLSVTSQLTVVAPTANVEPEGGLQATVAPEQLPDSVGWG